ncbi:putative reverse transcriptase domain-containing protein [Tanacetum coccineum]
MTGNVIRGLPSKIFQNYHTYVACQKGKQHKASCKSKLVSSISHSLQLLYMDLFGPTSVRSLNHKTYCLVITDDFKFKNRDFFEFYGSKGIKREYSNARTPQQNGVADRKNRTLIEAARTMLEDSFLPTTFWAEAVSTAFYVLNRVHKKLITMLVQKIILITMERIGPVAYRLRLPEDLSGVHDTFHVSNLKKCLADASLHVPLNEIKVDKTLRFIEEPVEILDHEIKSLKRSKKSLVKVRWDSKHGPKFT